jgi:NAD(P)-dependent dehydrogenase (short-subunit alcohol dehydrogenase family)
MKTVVITGSTRGIGQGLAKAFLQRGCSVVISGKSEASTNFALDDLKKTFDTKTYAGVPCDVQDFSQVQNLWDAAYSEYGRVDIWINNAGVSGDLVETWKQPPEITGATIKTNLLGVIYGSQVALNGMLSQGYGAIYNMEGAGSDGRNHQGMSLYGTTKYGLKYLNDALAQELNNTGIIIGALRPGMVITDFVLKRYEQRPEDLEKVKPIFNIIADRVEVVAPWLADRILSNKKNGTRINYSSRLKILARFFSMPFSKRDVFTNVSS